MVFMQPLKSQIHNLLIKNRKTVAVAESCTGGLLSKALTDISGSSRYFILGIIPYHNSAKKKTLKVPASIISKKGAVSQEAACKMAQEVRKLSGAVIGIGITGVAGPAGGTPAKPVGTVFIAIASKNRLIYRQFRFTGPRSRIRQKSTHKALELLKEFVFADGLGCF